MVCVHVGLGPRLVKREEMTSQFLLSMTLLSKELLNAPLCRYLRVCFRFDRLDGRRVVERSGGVVVLLSLADVVASSVSRAPHTRPARGPWHHVACQRELGCVVGPMILR